MIFKYLFPGVLCFGFFIFFFIRSQGPLELEKPFLDLDRRTTLPIDEKINNYEKASSTKEDRPISGESFDTAYNFYKGLKAGTQKWNEERGYSLQESFKDYQGPDSYNGTHPYGYLSENQLRELAMNKDIEAQFLYATYYLKNRPNEAVDMLSDIVVHTNQTAPLAEIGGVLFQEIRTRTLVADEGAQLEVQQAENRAYAYFLLMEQRRDPAGEIALNVMNYDSFDDYRKREIEGIVEDIQMEFISKRRDSRLPDFVDEPLDIPHLMGIDENEFLALKEKFYFSGMGPSDVP